MPFKELSAPQSQAEQIKGSVFDTWKDAILRAGQGDPMGGLAPMGISGPVGKGLNETLLDPLMARVSRIARQINPKRAEDLAQAGMEGILKGMQTTSMSGLEALRYARNAMRNVINEATGFQKGPIPRAVKNALGRVSPGEGEGKLLVEVRKTLSNPEDIKAMTLERLRKEVSNLEVGTRLKPGSLDAPVGASENMTRGDLLRNTENPETRALLSEAFDRLTDSQKVNLDKYLSGEPVNRAIVDRILRKTGIRGTPPISGGAGAMGNADYIQAMQQEAARLRRGGLDFERFLSTEPRGHPPTPAVYEQAVPNALRLDKPLYHATPAGPGVEASGLLEGRTSMTGVGSGLGGASHPGVSTAMLSEDADQTARMLARFGHVTREGLPDDVLMAMARLDATRKGITPEATDAYLQRVRESMDQVAQTPNTGVLGARRLSRYYSAREHELGDVNPYMMFPPSDAGEAGKVRRLTRIEPSSIRRIDITPDMVPPKASVSMGTDPGEFRIASDIPVDRANIWKYTPGSLLGFAGLGMPRQE